MSNALTIHAQNIAPVRCGYLGVGVPRIPTGLGDYDAMIAELTRRTGHELEVEHFGDDELGTGHWTVFDVTVGDALSEGESARDALEAALEQV